ARTALICGGTDPSRRNITSPLISSLDGGSGLARLDTSRLRAMWLRDCAELLGLATFTHVAGISSSQRLGDLIAGLDPAGEAGAVRLLGVVPRRPRHLAPPLPLAYIRWREDNIGVNAMRSAIHDEKLCSL
ncbi:MAG: hypothetical protein ACRDN0_02890, partial [Trebonia sp.]